MSFMAGFSGWVKNEGLLFFIVFSVAMLIANIRSKSFIKSYLLGALLPMIIIVVFKLFYAPANDVVAGQSGSSMSKLLDISRYIIVSKEFIKNTWKIYPVILVLTIGAAIFSRTF